MNRLKCWLLEHLPRSDRVLQVKIGNDINKGLRGTADYWWPRCLITIYSENDVGGEVALFMHEEIHHVLTGNVGIAASMRFDNITNRIGRPDLIYELLNKQDHIVDLIIEESRLRHEGYLRSKFPRHNPFNSLQLPSQLVIE